MTSCHACRTWRPQISALKTYESLTTDYHNITNEMLDVLKKHRYDTNKIRIFVYATGILVIFLFWRTIKSYITIETSDIATTAITDEKFKEHLCKLLDQLLLYLQNDPEAQKQIIQLLQTVVNNASNDKEFMDALNKLIGDGLYNGSRQAISKIFKS